MKKILIALLLAFPMHLLSQDRSAKCTSIHFERLTWHDNVMILTKDEPGEWVLAGDSMSISGPVLVQLDHKHRHTGKHENIIARQVQITNPAGSMTYNADLIDYDKDTRTAILTGNITEFDNGSSKRIAGSLELEFSKDGNISMQPKQQ